MNPLLLIGGGGHCVSCIDVLELEAIWRIEGIVDRDVGGTVLGYPVLGDDDRLTRLLTATPAALVTVGQIKSSSTRERLFEALTTAGAHIPVVVSPRAQVSVRATVGRGTIAMHGAVINAAAVVGSNCIINSQSLVEHGANVADHCHVATGAIVNGDATVGRGTFVGSGAVIREGVVVGERCLIGAGAVVLRDIPDGTIHGRSG